MLPYRVHKRAISVHGRVVFVPKSVHGLPTRHRVHFTSKESPYHVQKTPIFVHGRGLFLTESVHSFFNSVHGTARRACRGEEAHDNVAGMTPVCVNIHVNRLIADLRD